MLEALKVAGYERTKGGKGSHVKLTAEDKPMLVIPGGRKDLSPVVLRSIAKALGYRNPNELLEGLGALITRDRAASPLRRYGWGGAWSDEMRLQPGRR